MNKSSKLTSFLALAVFAVFAMCVMTVLVSGTRVYGGLVRKGRAQHAQRVAAQYVSMRVRQAEQVGVEEFGGTNALVLREKIEGETYLTRVYCHDGMLRELFCAEDAALAPEDGTALTEAAELSARLETGLLTVVIDGRKLVLRIPAGKEAVP